ncbi:Asp-tRNA(Asn)/Glu-tRNA(Gln) amidotransferase subunit GatA [Haliovirga abyssi]|uniref:Glutamyl-tRNA(Gln) amidotransferase subunit A n=1 Tax=Haliovirga abyssi TaxID=2996794 RepID=A0AAU9DBS7_9FUSO|nr:Asp-tRNA(Asn)/Glu-tRNA(Gln) amidotransferase subunit GatA [Haliovirga abyssi]BDU50916.1 glutamyl-tRNA(Gln) amidotransferase subunit A [Haliovirga abyssi]
MELYSLTAHELKELLSKKEIKSTEIVESVFNRIENVENKVDSFVTLTKEKAIEAAKKADEKLARGETLNGLEGIPIALKDNMVSMGDLTTASSKMLSNYEGIYDGSVVKKLKGNGIPIIGKTNMDEFAMGSSTENSFVKKTKNPWDLNRIPGGSSGGSAASVAAGESIISLGSDTGGSIRQPASLCGVVGLKPTYGRVSRFGLIAFASSLDQIGPITKDVEDAALALNAISGYDSNDSTSVNMEVPDYTKFLTEDIKGMKIGIPKEYFVDGMEAGVKKIVNESIERYRDLGAEIVEVSLPHTEYAGPAYYIVAPAEASSNLSRFDGVRYGYRTKEYKDLTELYTKSRSEGFGDEVKRRIMIGTYVLSAGYYDAYYKKAQKVRRLIKQDFDNAFNNVDVILTPTSPSVAFKIGEKTDDPLKMYLSDIFTISANLAGIPGMSVPAGLSEGLPVGIQLLGKAFGEGDILKAGYAFEKVRGKVELPKLK